MSGWFGTSNRGTNDPLDGIAAGHAARRNMQKQRYSPMGRITIDQMAEQNRTKPAVTMIPGGDKQAYKTFTLTSTFNSGLNKWVTSGRKGLKTFSAPGRSKGESVNAVKNKIDASLGQDKNKMAMFTDASSESVREVIIPPTDPGEVARFNRVKAEKEKAAQFTPVVMPKDFNTGTYTVRAVYGERNKKYTVSVIEGTIVKEVVQFNKSQGQGAAAKHMQLKNLATKKVNYENAKPRERRFTNYNVELQVVQDVSGLGGIFDGFLGMFGLGSASEAARFARRADSGIDKQRLTDGAAQQAVINQKMRDNIISKQSTRARTNTRALTPMQKFQQASNKSVSKFTPTTSQVDSSILRTINQNAKARTNTRTLSPMQKFQQASSKSVSKFTPTTSQVDSSILRTIAQKKSVTASKRPATTAKWSDMPAKSYKVITSRKDGTVVNESGAFTNYNQAAEAFLVEVSTVENSPEFYDQDAPLVLEVPRSTGDGGDITSNYQDPIIAQAAAKLAKEQAAAAAAAAAEQAAEAARFKRMKEQQAAEAAAKKAAAEAAAANAILEQNAEAERFARVAADKAAAEEAAALKAAADARAFEAQAAADALALQQQATAAFEAEKAAAMEALQQDSWAQVDTSGSENYNEIVQATETIAPTYIPEQEPGSIYIPQNLNDNPWVLKQQATTAVAPAVSSQAMGLALVGLAGLAYVANRK
jgi:hypothetical protein